MLYLTIKYDTSQEVIIKLPPYGGASFVEMEPLSRFEQYPTIPIGIAKIYFVSSEVFIGLHILYIISFHHQNYVFLDIIYSKDIYKLIVEEILWIITSRKST